MTLDTLTRIRSPRQARADHLDRLDEALAAIGSGEYRDALAAVLDAVALPVAATWAARRTSAVERIVRGLADRLTLDPEADFTHRDRVGLRLAAAHTAAHCMAPEPGVARADGRARPDRRGLPTPVARRARVSRASD